MVSLPKLNVNYWLMMLLCTTMGELIGNLLSRNLALGYTQGAVLDVCVFAAMIIAFVFFKFQNEVFYWILILMGNIGGTNLADWVTLDPLDNDKTWGILQPLQLGTKMGSLAVLTSLVLILLIRWMNVRRNGENSFYSIVFYWVAILLSSTFGTTSGDFITNDTPLGALWGSIALLVVLAFVFGAFKAKKVNAATAYWSALVLMHPVGATIGNWVSKPIGLNLGNVYTNIAMAIMFVSIYVLNSRAETTAIEVSDASNI